MGSTVWKTRNHGVVNAFNLLVLTLVAACSAAATAAPQAAGQRSAGPTASERTAEQAIELAQAHMVAGRSLEALAELRKATALAPLWPPAWYALGLAYDAVGQATGAGFTASADVPWQELLAADSALRRGRLVDAYVLYRGVQDRLPAMASIHDSVAGIYDRSNHPDWAAQERRVAERVSVDCPAHRALCEFRAGHIEAAFAAASGVDSESRYWRVRSAAELAASAFARLDDLPDSVERRSARAARARNEERYNDAVLELKAALRFVPRDPSLQYQLALAYLDARDFDRAIETASPLLRAAPQDVNLMRLVGAALLELARADEAVPVLRRASQAAPNDRRLRLMLGRATLQAGDFRSAIPLIEEQLAADDDGSLHLQLARAYRAIGRVDGTTALLERGQELQHAADERRSAAAQRSITPPPPRVPGVTGRK